MDMNCATYHITISHYDYWMTSTAGAPFPFLSPSLSLILTIVIKISIYCCHSILEFKRKMYPYDNNKIQQQKNIRNMVDMEAATHVMYSYARMFFYSKIHSNRNDIRLVDWHRPNDDIIIIIILCLSLIVCSTSRLFQSMLDEGFGRTYAQ